jgi:hypothetical protein
MTWQSFGQNPYIIWYCNMDCLKHMPVFTASEQYCQGLCLHHPNDASLKTPLCQHLAHSLAGCKLALQGTFFGGTQQHRDWITVGKHLCCHVVLEAPTWRKWGVEVEKQGMTAVEKGGGGQEEFKKYICPNMNGHRGTTPMVELLKGPSCSPAPVLQR